jgi:hypothetical protein
MDPSIYSKLPSGGSLWNYRYSHVNDFIQKTYENTHNEKAIYGINSSDKSDKTKISGVHNRENPRERKQTLMHFIIKHIDPLSSLYTYAMFEQAETIFRDRMSDFISKGVGQQWLGPKKSRVLLAWFTRNNHGVIDEMGKIIADFLSWFLETSFKYIPEHTRTIVESREENITYITYDKRVFIIK